ncbi:MAG: EsaB/YukD family protein [Firmicutes bacterium]|nr:EsaB/YukD family protein [Bacillota bacterium]
MASIDIEVWDVTGNKKRIVEVPDDEQVNRIIVVLIEKMNLPRYSPDGRLMSYKFHHKRLGRQIPDEETLFQAEVKSGDILRLQPEITAGGGVCLG